MANAMTITDLAGWLYPHRERARALSRSLMTAGVVITAPGDGWVFDPETGQSVPAPGPIVYDDVGHLHPASQVTGLRELLAGQVDLTARHYILGLPWESPTIGRGSKITATLDPASDPTGTIELTALGHFHLDSLNLTRRRVLCELIGDANPAGGAS